MSPATIQGEGPIATKTPPGAAQVASKAAAKKEALPTLSHLDKDIDAADQKGLIGPGAGRISDLELKVGDADPVISRLATRLMLAKMQVDAGIGGMRAASSPMLLARWDHLLSETPTAANMHAVVQVLREMVGGETPESGDALP